MSERLIQLEKSPEDHKPEQEVKRNKKFELPREYLSIKMERIKMERMIWDDLAKTEFKEVDGVKIYSSVIRGAFEAARSKKNYLDLTNLYANLAKIISKERLLQYKVTISKKEIEESKSNLDQLIKDKVKHVPSKTNYSWGDIIQTFHSLHLDFEFPKYIDPIADEIERNHLKGDVQTNYNIDEQLCFIYLGDYSGMGLSKRTEELLLSDAVKYEDEAIDDFQNRKIDLENIFFKQQNLARFFELYQIIS